MIAVIGKGSSYTQTIDPSGPDPPRYIGMIREKLAPRTKSPFLSTETSSSYQLPFRWQLSQLRSELVPDQLAPL